MEAKLDKKEVLKVIGLNIKKARVIQGLTQEILAELIDKSTNFVSLVERGESGMSLSTLVDICNVLEINISFVFEGVIPNNNNVTTENFTSFLSMLNKEDKAIVTSLVKYIVDNKLNK